MTDTPNREDLAKIFQLARGNWDDVIQRHVEYLGFYPTSSVGYFNLGLVFAERNQSDRAEIAFEQALKYNPDMVEAHINLGGMAFGQRDWDRSITFNREALRLKPGMHDPSLNIAFALYLKGDCEEALTAFEKVLEKQPKSGRAHYGLAVVLFDLEKYDASKVHYKRSLDLDFKPEPTFVQKMKGLDK